VVSHSHQSTAALSLSLSDCISCLAGSNNRHCSLRSRHIARLRMLVAAKILWRGISFWCTSAYSTISYSTIAVTGSTMQRFESGFYKTITASEASRKCFGLYPHLWHSGCTLVANEVENIKQICWVRRQIGRSCPVPSNTCLLTSVDTQEFSSADLFVRKFLNVVSYTLLLRGTQQQFSQHSPNC